MAIDKTAPVRIRSTVLDARRDAQEYRNQFGNITWVGANVPEFAMIYWPGLSCSSLWAVWELENTCATIA